MSNFYAKYPPNSGGGSGVTSLNSLTGALTLVAGSGITITPSGSNITIAATGASGANTALSNLTSPTAINQSLLFGAGHTIGSATTIAGPTSIFAGTSTLNNVYTANVPAFPGFSFFGNQNNIVATIGSTTATVTGFPYKGFVGFNTDFGNEFNFSSVVGFWLSPGSLDVTFATTQIDIFPSTQTIPQYNLGADGSFGLVNPTNANLLFTQVSGTPATPASGTERLYFKSDNNLYSLNSSSVETKISSALNWVKYTLSYTALTGFGGAGNVLLTSLAAKTVVHAVSLNLTTQFAGQSCMISIGYTDAGGNAQAYTSVFDATQTAGSEVGLYSNCNVLRDFAATTALNLFATSANLALLTQGSIDIYVLTSVLP